MLAKKIDVLRLSPCQQTYGTLYIGMTSNLARRIWEDRNSLVPGFTKRYQVEQLVWFRALETAAIALRREKQLKE